jgi:hypothetical protein
MRSSGEGKSGAGGSNSVFKGQRRRREEAMAGYWPSMAEGCRRLIAFKRGEKD